MSRRNRKWGGPAVCRPSYTLPPFDIKVTRPADHISRSECRWLTAPHEISEDPTAAIVPASALSFARQMPKLPGQPLLNQIARRLGEVSKDLDLSGPALNRLSIPGEATVRV